jgi:hypothetical protein
MAASIPNARFKELLPGDHLAGDPGVLASAILDFVIGTQPALPTTHRTLATLLFTDIVGSTEAVSAQGDAVESQPRRPRRGHPPAPLQVRRFQDQRHR